MNNIHPITCRSVLSLDLLWPPKLPLHILPRLGHSRRKISRIFAIGLNAMPHFMVHVHLAHMAAQSAWLIKRPIRNQSIDESLIQKLAYQSNQPNQSRELIHLNLD